MTDTKYVRLLSSLYISTFFIRASFGIILATLPMYLGISKEFTWYGVVSSASPLLEFFTVLFIGVIVDRFGRRSVLLSGLFIAFIVLLMFSLSKNLYTIFIINAFNGIAAGAILVSSLALLTDCAPVDRRGREMGAFDAVNLLGWVTGYALGALFLEFLKTQLWQGFVIASVMALAGLIYSHINVKETVRRTEKNKTIRFSNIIQVFKQRSILLLTLPWFIVFMMIGAVMAFLTVSTSQGQLNISPVVLSAAIFIGGLGLIGTQVFYGRMSDKYGRIPIMIIGTVGFVGIMLTIGLAYVLAASTSPDDIKASIIKFIIPIGLFAFMALAFGPSALSSLADEAHEDMRGVTMAVYSLVISLGMFIGIPTVAIISDHFGGLGVLGFMFICAVSMFLLVIIRYLDIRHTQKSHPEEEILQTKN